MTNRNGRVSVLSDQRDPIAVDNDLARLHLDSTDSVAAGRNITAGYARGWGLEYGGLAEFIAADPVYQESVGMARSRSLLLEHKLMNLFLIMKYGARNDEGDFVEFGS